MKEQLFQPQKHSVDILFCVVLFTQCLSFQDQCCFPLFIKFCFHILTHTEMSSSNTKMQLPLQSECNESYNNILKFHMTNS